MIKLVFLRGKKSNDKISFDKWQYLEKACMVCVPINVVVPSNIILSVIINYHIKNSVNAYSILQVV
jgi:hypothetical protein